MPASGPAGRQRGAFPTCLRQWAAPPGSHAPTAGPSAPHSTPRHPRRPPSRPGRRESAPATPRRRPPCQGAAPAPESASPASAAARRRPSRCRSTRRSQSPGACRSPCRRQAARPAQAGGNGGVRVPSQRTRGRRGSRIAEPGTHLHRPDAPEVRINLGLGGIVGEVLHEHGPRGRHGRANLPPPHPKDAAPAMLLAPGRLSGEMVGRQPGPSGKPGNVRVNGLFLPWAWRRRSVWAELATACQSWCFLRRWSPRKPLSAAASVCFSTSFVALGWHIPPPRCWILISSPPKQNCDERTRRNDRPSRCVFE